MVAENAKRILGKDDILSLFHSLAQSQGFYGRLLRDYYNGDTELVDALADYGFTDTLDVILAVEQ